MTARIPHQALSFGVQAAKLAARHGLKSGVAKAASRANPVLMALGAAEAVLDAANSWLKLKAARVERDGLKALIPKEDATLKAERQILKEEITLAREDLRQEHEVRERIGKITLLCAQICSELTREMLEVRNSELPDIARFDQLSNQKDLAWAKMQDALDYYNRSI